MCVLDVVAIGISYLVNSSSSASFQLRCQWMKIIKTSAVLHFCVLHLSALSFTFNTNTFNTCLQFMYFRHYCTWVSNTCYYKYFISLPTFTSLSMSTWIYTCLCALSTYYWKHVVVCCIEFILLQTIKTVKYMPYTFKHLSVCSIICLSVLLLHNLTYLHENMKLKPLLVNLVKVKLSCYTPWRHLGGEEV
jgi:hypothetical protein